MSLSRLASTLVVLLLAALVGSAVLYGAWLDRFGATTTGRITGRHEAISLDYGGQWQRVCTVDYTFRPAGTARDQTGSHRVAPQLYHRLRVGEGVRVRYSHWPVLDSWASALADAPFTTRLPDKAPGTSVSNLEGLGFLLACALAFVAWRRRSWTLGGVAAIPIIVFLSASLLLGFLVFPLLVVLWRRRPGRGLGWVLIAGAAGSVALLWWRLPTPPPMPAGPQAETIATVRHLRHVDSIFGTWRSRGQSIRTPFDMVDLEYTPAGAAEPVHAVDFVDSGSVQGLAPGARVPVVHARADPTAARVLGARRDAVPQAFRDMLGLTLVLGVLAWFAGALLDRVGHRFDRFASSARGIDPDPGASKPDSRH